MNTNIGCRSVALAGALVMVPLGCVEPTEAIVEISTDNPCESLNSTGITAGLLGDIETRGYGTTTSLCTGNGEIGSIVLLPPEDKDDSPFAFKVVASLEAPVETACVAPVYGPSCIVARRAMRFVPNHPFHVPVRLSQACAGVFCPDEQTCVEGTCRSATVDPNGCDGDGTCTPDPAVAPPWQKHFTGSGVQMARHLALSADGTLVVTGNFDGTLDLGGGALTGKGGQDIFVATYAQSGAHRWSTSFGGAGNEEVSRAAIGANGAVYVLVQFEGTVDFGGGPLVSAGESDVAILKLTTYGKLEWAVQLGGTMGDQAGAVAVGDDGNVYASGVIIGSAKIAGTKLEAAGNTDAFLVSLTPAGNLRWAKALGGAGYDGANGMGVDAKGHVYVTGFFEKTVDFGLPEPVTATNTSDAFLMSLDKDGGLRWAKFIGADGADRLMDVAVRGERVVVTGRIAGSTTMDGVAVNALHKKGLVAAYDTSGTLAWAETFGSDDSGTGESIGIAADESIVIGGEITQGSVFGSGPETLPGNLHPFVAVLERDGKTRWSQLFSSSVLASATGVAAPAAGFVYFAGWFNGELDLGPGTEALKSEGGEDAFLFRLPPPPP